MSVEPQIKTQGFPDRLALGKSSPAHTCISSGQAQEAEQVVQLEIEAPETANEAPSHDQQDDKSLDKSLDDKADQSNVQSELDRSQDEENEVSVEDDAREKQEEEESEQSTAGDLVRITRTLPAPNQGNTNFDYLLL